MNADLAEVARFLRFPTAWERRFHEYDLLTKAGLSDEEAERIASLAAFDRLCTDIAAKDEREARAA